MSTTSSSKITVPAGIDKNNDTGSRALSVKKTMSPRGHHQSSIKTIKASIGKNNDVSRETYPGGKNGAGVYQTLINKIPPHEIYIETHLGGAAIMKHLRPAKLNIGVDLDPNVINQAATIFKNVGGGSQYVFKNDDAARYLKECDLSHMPVFIYSDPPYLMETRKSGKLYNFEYTEDQHLELLSTLKAMPCMVMISGYWSEMYADMLSDWNSFSFKAMTRQGLATEWVWYNYPDPTELHDYSFLGSNFRERERIKRKIVRWANKLRNLPVLERRAILEKLNSDPLSLDSAIVDQSETQQMRLF